MTPTRVQTVDKNDRKMPMHMHVWYKLLSQCIICRVRIKTIMWYIYWEGSNHGDSSLQSVIGDSNVMILDDTGAQNVSAGFTLFWSEVDDMHNSYGFQFQPCGDSFSF